MAGVGRTIPSVAPRNGPLELDAPEAPSNLRRFTPQQPVPMPPEQLEAWLGTDSVPDGGLVHQAQRRRQRPVRPRRIDISERAEDVQDIIRETRRRLDRSPERHGGRTPRQVYDTYVAENSAVTDQHIRDIWARNAADISEGPDARRTLDRYGIPRDSSHHRWTRDLVAGMIGEDPARVSAAAPGLGVTGSVNNPWVTGLELDDNPTRALGTFLHDTTSYLYNSGVRGFQRGIWGTESDITSARTMYYTFEGLPPPPR